MSRIRPPRRPERQDVLLTALVAAVSGLFAAYGFGGGSLAPLAWLLLAGCVLPLLWRRQHPLAVLVVSVGFSVVYHALDFPHAAPVTASMVAVYTLAAVGPRSRTLWVGGVVVAAVAVVMLATDAHQGLELLRATGWVVAVLATGEAVRMHRRYIGAIKERAERAERTREEEAARRVAEERLRIARDLHDLLAHSITLIGVQTSVASHVLIADPGRLDREAVARALDGIADTCRDARAELRTTLEVLRADGPDTPDGPGGGGPLPGVSGIPDLVRTAEAAGATVGLELRPAGPVPPAVSAAAYRIVQEALTNAVRHAGPVVRIEVSVLREAGALRVSVTDEGAPAGARAGADPAGAQPAGAPSGYGIPGMRERARSVGGTLEAGQRPGGGFAVTAVLPVLEENR
ncbi:histidine kinase [Streptomyces sodiiphilus]|uniref:histidine kinase n=1 Tax=Streptomyces sodiiphilus TaxID=226217 RepID=A0ABN2PMH2_9ACTN